MSTAPSVGDASMDEHFVQERARVEEVRVEKLRTYETDHLCLRCTHAHICHVVAAIKDIDGEGDVVISSCGAFEEPRPSLADLIVMAESADESDEDHVKDRR